MFAWEVPPLGLLSLAYCSLVAKWYMSIGLFSHWRICFLLSSQTTHLRGPGENHWKIILPVAIQFCLTSPLPHCFLLFFSLHITERLNFYKSYIHKTFLSLSWWEIRRAHTPGLPRMENSIWETNWLSWRLVHEQTLPWTLVREGRFKEKVKENPSHRVWSSSRKRTRPKSRSITGIISELKQLLRCQEPQLSSPSFHSPPSLQLPQKATKTVFYSPILSRMICTYLP